MAIVPGQISDTETALHRKIVNTIDSPTYTLYAGVEVHPSHVSVPAANTAATVTFAAVAGSRNLFEFVAWSYSDDPTGGRLYVHNNAGTVYFDITITSGGPGFIPFTPEMSGVGSALYVTLAAGGAGISGKVNVMGHRVVAG